MQLDLFREIIVDNFAGGGGASTGIEMATGLSVDIAINHDPAAIAMHKANHPDTEHYCESVWDVDPVKAVKGRKVGLAWFSPDCKHFSKAKGSKPVEKSIRGLAWVAVRWASKVKPRVIMLENVEEFQTWGPLIAQRDKTGRILKIDGTIAAKGEVVPFNEQVFVPNPNKKGRTFEQFINALKKLGYQVEFKELKACNYGAPTIRKRFFMVARCDGKPIEWPKPTHGDPQSLEVKAGRLKPWRTASEIIDWDIGTPSIFERKKPLSDNTLRRIARGIQKFVIENPSPFIVRIGQTGFGGDKLSYPLNKPLTTITTKAEHCLVNPVLIQMGYGDPEGKRVLDLDKPLGTITAGGNKFGLATAYIMQNYSASIGQSLEEPLWSTTAVNKANLVTAFLTKYYGADIGQSLNEPLHTVTTKDRFGLITIKGNEFQIVDIGMRMLKPHELFAAQGFPSNYIIDKDDNGTYYSQAKQVARCGNAVPPPFAESLVRANLPEFCVKHNRYKPAMVM
ncbi:DNA cytosine methyltransferase [Neobacillus sp. NPDC093127]|uniref:DNA cytosine methyltransferase n=1 Tax=Neobacillus sp. NPDC093127 TaxID=3364296 RepID=UPI00380C7565